MSLPRPRAIESIVLGRYLNDFVIRGDWFRASLLQPRAFESMVLYTLFFHDLCPPVIASGT